MRANLGTSNKVDIFIASLKLQSDIAFVVLESDKDCYLFLKDFHLVNRYSVDDLLDFREHKIDNSYITLDLFVDMCYNLGMRKAFESTFYQPFTEADIEMVEDALTGRKVTLESLYTDFKKNPNKNVLKNVL